MLELMTAEEARRKADQSKIMPNILKDISFRITEAASGGFYSVVYTPDRIIDDTLYGEIRKILAGYGYKVGWLSSLNKLIIKW